MWLGPRLDHEETTGTIRERTSGGACPIAAVQQQYKILKRKAQTEGVRRTATMETLLAKGLGLLFVVSTCWASSYTDYCEDEKVVALKEMSASMRLKDEEVVALVRAAGVSMI